MYKQFISCQMEEYLPKRTIILPKTSKKRLFSKKKTVFLILANQYLFAWYMVLFN